MTKSKGRIHITKNKCLEMKSFSGALSGPVLDILKFLATHLREATKDNFILVNLLEIFPTPLSDGIGMKGTSQNG